ncbi:MFS transporter [uncultured Gilvimarinus sp.]|uniref:MFS transporter n=1 Tax=uncultured Gilvimarinus sp. TaxID=1689143 RepID=UPI0030EC55F5|tara:strand:+ start:2483 stop:3637 length:1155 start_codon:yes stop_codon:yes gene_type:complete
MSPHPASSQAQHATRAAFFIAGSSLAAWAPLVPYAQIRANLNEAQLGLLLLCLGVGSLIAMPLSGLLTGRFGCRKVFTTAALTLCVALPVLACTPSSGLLAVTLFIFGAGLGTADCVANIQAVTVEKASGRALMSGFHGLFSLGGIVGALSVSALLSAGLSPLYASVSIALLLLLAIALTKRHLLSHTREASDTTRFALPHGIVILLGLLCFIAFLAEGAMLDWSAVHLHQQQQMATAHAGLGYVAFAITMTLGRLTGDAIIQRVGLIAVLVIGAGLAALGLTLAALAPSWQVALAGYALVGLGGANIAPIMYSLVGKQTAMPESQAVPALTTIGYAGILVGPAMIGFVAYLTGLTAAFLLVAGFLLTVAAVGPALGRAFANGN